MGNIIIYFTKEAKIFDKYGLDVEPIAVNGSGIASRALNSGSVQISPIATPTVINSVLSGSDMVILGHTMPGVIQYLMARPDIKRTEDIKGKSIGVTPYGGLSDFLVRHLARQRGLVPDAQGASLFAYSAARTNAGGLNGVFEGNMSVQKFSDRALIVTNKTASASALLIDTKATSQDLKKSIFDPRQSSTPKFFGYNLVNLDIRGISSTVITNSSVYLVNSTGAIILRQSGSTGAEAEVNATATTTKLIPIANNVKPQSLTLLNSTGNSAQVYSNIFGSGVTGRGIDAGGTVNTKIGFLVNFTRVANVTATAPIAIDLFSFGYKNDGLVKVDRVNNMIVRIEAEETGDNTSVFEGTLEFVVLNQLNILDRTTYTGLTTIADDPTFIVHQDLDDEEAPRVNYNDLGADGVITQVADQEDAPTHSGVVSFDKPTLSAMGLATQ